MKLFILSDPMSIHTKRWVKSLSEQMLDIFLFGFRDGDLEFYSSLNNVSVFTLDLYNKNTKTTDIGKLKYLRALRVLKQKLYEFQPDILHAHYASSYGLLGALANFHPYIISVWGSDVYNFPKKSFLHRLVFRYNLSKADCVLSTSQIMVREIHKYTSKKIEITPFGVNVDLFKKTKNHRDWNADFVIGNVKTLLPIYGIDTLIKAFRLVIIDNPGLNVKLVIVGDGSCKEEYINLAKYLGIEEKVLFQGQIPNDMLPEFYNSFSVSVSLSNSESFGVVAVEAMSCECPVITSDADGFTEVVKNGETGFIIPKRDEIAAAKAIQKFIDNPELRDKMGKKGRERVLLLYDWRKNVGQMVEIYHRVFRRYCK